MLFQVAGGCGLGALKAADEPRSGASASTSTSTTTRKRVLTSAHQAGRRRASTTRSQQAAAGKFQGGTDLLFDLKNSGVGVGKINPSVPAAWVTLMNSYKAKIIAGTLKVPTAIASSGRS